MNKYIIIVLLAVTAVFTSCSDMLNLQNDGRITMDEIFTTRNGVRGYINTCYDNRPQPTLTRSSLCDDAQNSNGTYANSLYNFWYGNAFSATLYLNVDNVDGNPWTHYYTGIRNCNVFLANMVNVTTNTIDASEAELSAWTAQAHALRALYYLQLIKRYGDVPLITEPLETNHNYGSDSKASVSTVVTQILADCDAALSAPDVSEGFSWNVLDGQNGIMTRAVAHAIKSEAVTYAASPLFSDGTYTWDDATRINKEALYQCTTHDYRLFTDVPAANIAQNAYALYFITRHDVLRAYDKETIYGGPAVAVWQTAGMPSTPGQMEAGSCPTQELVDSYEMQATGEPPVLGYSDAQHLTPIINTASGYNPNDPYTGRDPRFYATVYYNGALRTLDGSGVTVDTYAGTTDGITKVDRRTTHTGYYLRKYNNWQSNRDNSADGEVRLFRLAVLYLNFAESAYQSAGPDVPVELGAGVSMSARDAVNVIRRRAGMPDFPSGLSKADFEKKYRNERRVELAFEEHRYFDVRRWKILEETEHYLTGMSITREGDSFNYTRIGFERGSWINKYYFYPLEQAEVNKMQDYTGVNWQNQGW
jgi:hypothetical protein